LVYHLQNCY